MIYVAYGLVLFALLMLVLAQASTIRALKHLIKASSLTTEALGMHLKQHEAITKTMLELHNTADERINLVNQRLDILQGERA